MVTCSQGKGGRARVIQGEFHSVLGLIITGPSGAQYTRHISPGQHLFFNWGRLAGWVAGP